MITKKEFLAKLSPEELERRLEYRVVLPCKCGDESCEGWAFVVKDVDMIMDHIEEYLGIED